MFTLQLLLLILVLLIILFFYLQQRGKRENERLEEINRALDREIQERTNKELLLGESENLYRFLTNNTLDVIIRMDRMLHYLYISPSLKKMFGYPPDDLSVIPTLEKLIHPDFLDEMRRQYHTMIRQQKPITFTHLAVRAGGEHFWAESLMNPIFDRQTHCLQETITVIRDVSERIAFEEALQKSADQNALLLREIHHRVKNNFAILVSLIDLQERRSGHKKYGKLIADLQQRIRTMSLVHEMLYRSEDISSILFGEYILRLTQIISMSAHTCDVTVTHDLEPCELNIDTALPLSLIINEILSNAYKHAFSSMARGTLWIVLQRVTDPLTLQPTDRFRLNIRDDGPGFPHGFTLDPNASMGAYLILMLTEQIEGELLYENNKGASFTLTFPLKER